MLAGAPRLSKISREVSNFIVSLVLERAEDLIRNSYRRLTTENVARNEHWANIAEIVSENFETMTEMERVKSHFHNRKKVLLARMKEEFKSIPGISIMSIDEKLEELVKRRICCGEHDEQLARVCLEVEEEEKTRTDMEGSNANIFNEQNHHSLLSQLLNSTPNNGVITSQDEVASTNTEPEQSTRAPLLSKLLSEATTSTSNTNCQQSNSSTTVQNSTTHDKPTVNDRKRRATSSDTRQLQLSIPPQRPYLSHLIVDVTSPNELKKLLSVLIDHGFCRFQHVDSIQNIAFPNPAVSQRHSELNLSGLNSFVRDENVWKNTAASSNDGSLDIDVVKDIQSRVERVDVEVKLEPDLEYDDEFDQAHIYRSQENEFEEPESNEEEDIDSGMEYKLEMEMLSDANRKGLALFDKVTDQGVSTAKKLKLNGESSMIPCQLCGTVIRLNTGGSKWNLYEHVMLKHSNNKAYKCTLCNYGAGRRIRIRQHARTQHGATVEPIDLTTPEIRKEWLTTMSKCFPQNQYGKNTIASKIYTPE